MVLLSISNIKDYQEVLVLSDFCLRILCASSEGGLYDGPGGSERQVTKLLFDEV